MSPKQKKPQSEVQKSVEKTQPKASKKKSTPKTPAAQDRQQQQDRHKKPPESMVNRTPGEEHTVTFRLSARDRRLYRECWCARIENLDRDMQSARFRYDGLAAPTDRTFFHGTGCA